MRKQDRLQKEALESCKFRGHEMKRFMKFTKTFSVSLCRKCGKEAFVNAKPPPNGIDISGEAVALGCEVIKPLWVKQPKGEKGGTIGGDERIKLNSNKTCRGCKYEYEHRDLVYKTCTWGCLFWEKKEGLL